MEVFERRHGGWYWFFGPSRGLGLDPNKCGKWMHFFSDQRTAIDVCRDAVAVGVCEECKCTDMLVSARPTGVICFYINGDDPMAHAKVLSFMVERGLIPKGADGSYEDIPFKYDYQTRAGLYGPSFVPVHRASDFMDLRTGRMVV